MLTFFLKGGINMMKSMRQASAESGLSYHFIRQLCLNNKIKYVKSGKKFYVNMESLKEYCSGKTDSNLN